MKVIHIVEAWKGGVASYVQALIEDQLQRGFNVTLIADVKELDTDRRNLEVAIVNYTSSRNPLKAWRIAQHIRREIDLRNPDVVHCHSTFPGVYTRLFKHKCKVIYTPHAWSFFKQDSNAIERTIYRLVEQWLGRRSNKVVCISLEEATAARDLLPAEKIALVYTGISRAHKPDVGKLTPSAGEKITVGFFGRFDYQKGFDLLENAFPLLNSNIEVHLFGGFVRGEEREINPKIINHGWIKHDEVSQNMLLMDIILIPSRWEGFALTPLEAMRAGRPVIVSNASSLPEVVIHGFNGAILSENTGQAIAEILNGLKKSECARMGLNAMTVYEQTFTFDAFSDNMATLYEKC